MELGVRAKLLFDHVVPIPGTEPPILDLKEYETIQNGDRVCLFASYSKTSEIDASVMNYLHHLNASGFKVVFITTSKAISETDSTKLRDLVHVCIHRENRGYDFYSWKEGFRYLSSKKLHLEGILVANDSVEILDPGLEHLWTHIDQSSADIVGATDSHNHGLHLQSYFIYYKSPAANSAVVFELYDRIKELRHKSSIIRSYEVGFSKKLQRFFKLEAIWKTSQILSENPEIRNKRINISTRLWRTMRDNNGYVFMKKSQREQSDPGKLDTTPVRT